MATTHNQIIERALKRLGLTQVGETPSGDEYADGLRAYNDMLNGWRNKGIFVPFTTVADDAGGDEVPFDDEDVGGIANNLAVVIASEYGKNPSPILIAQAVSDRNGLWSKYGASLKSSVDSALLPSRRRGIRSRIFDG